MNILLSILGLISLSLGVLGAFVPVLPTTPFLLLAAFLFLRGNKRLYEWLMNHPRMGAYISNFVEHKAIPLRGWLKSLNDWLVTFFRFILHREDSSDWGGLRSLRSLRTLPTFPAWSSTTCLRRAPPATRVRGWTRLRNHYHPPSWIYGIKI